MGKGKHKKGKARQKKQVLSLPPSKEKQNPKGSWAELEDELFRGSD